MTLTLSQFKILNMQKLKDVFFNLTNNQEHQIIFFNTICALIYWGWEIVTDFLIDVEIVDNTRFLVVAFALIIHALYFYKKFSIHLSGFLIQSFLISHYGYLMFINNYHYVYIMGYILIMVLQSLTFKHKKFLFSYYIFTALLSTGLVLLAQTNQMILLFNALTVLILGPFAALIRIRGEEKVLKQTKEINLLKVQQNISKLSSTLTHEINTPLTTILGYTEFLNQNRLQSKLSDEKSITKIEVQVKKIKEITNMLSLLSTDPKKTDGSDVITSEEIRSYVLDHIKGLFYDLKMNISFFSPQSCKYSINSGQMFYILNDLFQTIPKIKGTTANIDIIFNKDSILILSDLELQINDLNTTPSQCLANNYGYNIVKINKDTKYGILIEKDRGIK